MANEKKAPEVKALEGKGHLSEEAKNADLGPESYAEARDKGYIGEVPDGYDYSVSAVLANRYVGNLKQPEKQNDK